MSFPRHRRGPALKAGNLKGDSHPHSFLLRHHRSGLNSAALEPHTLSMRPME